MKAFQKEGEQSAGLKAILKTWLLIIMRVEEPSFSQTGYICTVSKRPKVKAESRLSRGVWRAYRKM